MNNPIEALSAWLERPVYRDGVLLYEQLIGSDFYLKMFKTGDDDYNRDLLTTSLQKKLIELQQAERERVAAYLESLVEQLADGGLLQDERTIIKVRMRDLYNAGITESEELKTYAYRILEIKDGLDQTYGRRDFYEQHGFLPEAASLPEADDPTDLLRKRNNLRTYVSKYTKELDEPISPGRRKKIGKRLQRFTSELHKLDNQLQHLSP
ncbi:hypothetical protein GCM10028805_52050 [Spirosoma harenae]